MVSILTHICVTRPQWVNQALMRRYIFQFTCICWLCNMRGIKYLYFHKQYCIKFEKCFKRHNIFFWHQSPDIINICRIIPTTVFPSLDKYCTFMWIHINWLNTPALSMCFLETIHIVIHIELLTQNNFKWLILLPTLISFIQNWRLAFMVVCGSIKFVLVVALLNDFIPGTPYTNRV